MNEPGLFLTDDELKALTHAVRSPTQIEWLRNNRWLFEISRTGKPRVARAYLERRMVGGEQVHEIAPAEPPAHNFAALDARG